MQAQSTVHCFKDYSLKHLEGQESFKAREEVAQAVQTTTSTVLRWTKDSCVPIGENLLRLRFFLEKKGYKVSEVEGLESLVQQLGRHIYDRRLDLDSVYKALGLSSKDHLLRILRGAVGLSGATEAKVSGFLNSQINKSSENGSVAKQKPQVSEVMSKDQLMQGFAHLLWVLKPYVQVFVSDLSSPEDRAKVRKLAGQQTIFDISVDLRKLCSETSFQHETTKAPERGNRGE